VQDHYKRPQEEVTKKQQKYEAMEKK